MKEDKFKIIVLTKEFLFDIDFKFYIITIFCLAMLVSMPIVRAENKTSMERELAIACALAYFPLEEGGNIGMNQKLVGSKIAETADFFNEKVNLHDFASSKELADWKVVDFHSKEITEKSLAAFVLQKDNDVMFIFRATDLEAVGDILYGINNYHGQEEYAIKYVLEMMEEYSKKEGNYNLYVAGHSLGGYLAQITGATIEQNIDNYENLNLKKIVSFNGIGINFFTYFGDKYNYGNQAKNIETLKALGNDGRLIEYFTFGDVVSALGIHYGEMRMILPSIDSVTYQRSNFSLLRDARKNTKLLNSTIESLAKDQFFNIFKTEIETATKLYGTESLIEYILLTHETDSFVALENEKSLTAPELKIVENKGVVGDALNFFLNTAQDLSNIETKKSITLKAVTSHASAKKYVWEVSSDKQNWEVVKVSTVDMNDPDYNPNELPTNDFEIDINTINPGETKYYRITSYYDDNYVSMKYSYNEEKGLQGEYEYVENKEMSKQEERNTLERIIEVKRPEEKKTVKKLKDKLQNIKTKFSNFLKKLRREQR